MIKKIANSFVELAIFFIVIKLISCESKLTLRDEVVLFQNHSHATPQKVLDTRPTTKIN